MAKFTVPKPFWKTFLIWVGIFVGIAIFGLIAGTLITDWANGLPVFTSIGDIWFSIFPSLKKTAETVAEEVIETTTNLI